MPVDGIYKLESSSNMPAAFKALGFDDSLTKRFIDPKNEVIYNLSETKPGVFEYSSTMSLVPEWNSSNCVKLGETKELTEPIPMKITYTKNSDTSYTNKTEMNGKVMVSEQKFNNYGMISNTTVEGTNISFREIFKKVTPNMTGYFTFESETGLAEFMAAIGFGDMDMNSLKEGMAFSVTDRGTCCDVTEYFGGDKKCYTAVYGKEYCYERADWNICDKRMTTITAPGVMTTVSKNPKTGLVWEYSMTFNDRGVTINSKAGNVKCTETYKRMLNVVGTWRTVSCSGAEAHGAALGLTGAALQGYVDTRIGEMFTMERLVGGALKFNTNSTFFPAGDFIMKSGEQYSIDLPGMGKMTGIGHEGCDEWMQALKMNGKTISQYDKMSGDFLISTAIVDGCKASTMVSIMVRD